MPELKHYIDLIKAGEIVAFPTETVYGLGADAWNPESIRKIFEAKGRPSDNPLIVHLLNKEQVCDFVLEVPPLAQKLMDAFWPGPLTIILKKKPKVLDLITAGLDTVALRIPAHPLALKLIEGTGPLVAPSANKSGRPSPTKAQHVKKDFGNNFPVIDGGETKVGLESTVIDLTSEKPVILRPGKIGKLEIEELLKIEVSIGSNERADVPKSPGQKYSHYKPDAWVKYGKIKAFRNDVLYLTQHEYQKSKNIISYGGDLSLLSKELYDRFRQTDLEKYAGIFIEEISPYQENFPSLYMALTNRINKAVGKTRNR